LKKACLAILSLVLVLCIGAAGAIGVCGTGNDAREADPPPTRLSYIMMTATSISISGGQASCTGSITGYNGTTTKVVITLYLERKLASSSTWSTYASDPSQTFNSFYGQYTMKKSVVKGYQYRVRAVYKAYAGSNSETLTGYSSVVAY
jgi:hypothetical protein